MFKVTSQKKLYGQSFLDEMPDRPDRDADDKLINEQNYEDYLADEFAKDDQQVINENSLPDTGFQQPTEDFLGEIPKGNEALGIPQETIEKDYPNPLDLVYDGIEAQEVISFDYTNRHGIYAGTRTVEPHYTFIAYSTGNEVLVTFDRDINDIRAFIVGNIHPNGVRYEGVKFAPRPEIMVGVA